MKQQRFVVAGDNHGDQVDTETERALGAFLKEFRPEIRIHSGDCFDFRNFRKGAGDDEKAHSLAEDWEAGSQFLRKFFEGGKQNVLLRGNHDERLWYLESAVTGVLRDYARDGIRQFTQLVSRSKATMLPYDARLGIFRLGHMKVLHGYFSGAGAARRHSIAYRNCLFGHTHATDSAPVECAEGPAEARGIGCCCKIDMTYNQHMPGKLRHDNAWCYGFLFEDGTYQLFQAKKLNGRFYAATTIKEL